jgi:hypothetical protein
MGFPKIDSRYAQTFLSGVERFLNARFITLTFALNFNTNLRGKSYSKAIEKNEDTILCVPV